MTKIKVFDVDSLVEKVLSQNGYVLMQYSCVSVEDLLNAIVLLYTAHSVSNPDLSDAALGNLSWSKSIVLRDESEEDGAFVLDASVIELVFNNGSFVQAKQRWKGLYNNFYYLNYLVENGVSHQESYISCLEAYFNKNLLKSEITKDAFQQSASYDVVSEWFQKQFTSTGSDSPYIYDFIDNGGFNYIKNPILLHKMWTELDQNPLVYWSSRKVLLDTFKLNMDSLMKDSEYFITTQIIDATYYMAGEGVCNLAAFLLSKYSVSGVFVMMQYSDEAGLESLLFQGLTNDTPLILVMLSMDNGTFQNGFSLFSDATKYSIASRFMCMLFGDPENPLLTLQSFLEGDDKNTMGQFTSNIQFLFSILHDVKYAADAMKNLDMQTLCSEGGLDLLHQNMCAIASMQQQYVILKVKDQGKLLFDTLFHLNTLLHSMVSLLQNNDSSIFRSFPVIFKALQGFYTTDFEKQLSTLGSISNVQFNQDLDSIYAYFNKSVQDIKELTYYKALDQELQAQIEKLNIGTKIEELKNSVFKDDISYWKQVLIIKDQEECASEENKNCTVLSASQQADAIALKSNYSVIQLFKHIISFRSFKTDQVQESFFSNIHSQLTAPVFNELLKKLIAEHVQELVDISEVMQLISVYNPLLSAYTADYLLCSLLNSSSRGVKITLSDENVFAYKKNDLFKESVNALSDKWYSVSNKKITNLIGKWIWGNAQQQNFVKSDTLLSSQRFSIKDSQILICDSGDDCNGKATWQTLEQKAQVQTQLTKSLADKVQQYGNAKIMSDGTQMSTYVPFNLYSNVTQSADVKLINMQVVAPSYLEFLQFISLSISRIAPEIKQWSSKQLKENKVIIAIEQIQKQLSSIDVLKNNKPSAITKHQTTILDAFNTIKDDVGDVISHLQIQNSYEYFAKFIIAYGCPTFLKQQVVSWTANDIIFNTAMHKLDDILQCANKGLDSVRIMVLSNVMCKKSGTCADAKSYIQQQKEEMGELYAYYKDLKEQDSTLVSGMNLGNQIVKQFTWWEKIGEDSFWSDKSYFDIDETGHALFAFNSTEIGL